MNGVYQRELEARWREDTEPFSLIADKKDRAIALLAYATSEGADFLALADDSRDLPPLKTDEGWADFFERTEAGMARKMVHAAANSAFMAMSIEDKLLALTSVEARVLADGTEESNG